MGPGAYLRSVAFRSRAGRLIGDAVVVKPDVHIDRILTTGLAPIDVVVELSVVTGRFARVGERAGDLGRGTRTGGRGVREFDRWPE